MFTYLAPQSLIFTPTEEMEYTARRKALASAFFKAKLRNMTKVIFRTVYKQLQTWDRNGEDGPTQINLIKQFNEFQGQVLINCAFGEGIGDTKLPFEYPDGRIE